MTLPASPTLIRPARPADANAITELIAPFVASGQILPSASREIRHLMATGFVAEQAGRIVGFAALEVYSPKLAEVRSLAVIEEQQRQGVGSQLVGACVELARQRNVLEVMAITSSEEFFQGCGFDFTLPGEKKALFIQPSASGARAPSAESSPS
jgi:N-acetylglutamate synthase-like GNAT family acetyltransferase